MTDDNDDTLYLISVRSSDLDRWRAAKYTTRAEFRNALWPYRAMEVRITDPDGRPVSLPLPSARGPSLLKRRKRAAALLAETEGGKS